MARVMIPPAWRPYTGAPEVTVAGATIAELARALARETPHLERWFFETDGALKQWVNFFVNGQDIRMLKGAETPLAPDDEVRIVLAVSAG